MIATGPFANILWERAALLVEVVGVVETVVEDEPDDELGLGLEEEEEVKVAGREPVEVSEDKETALEELLETVEDVSEADVVGVVATEVVGEVAGEDGNGDSVIGPGPRLNQE